MLLMQYRPAATKVFLVNLVPAWVATMLRWMQFFKQHILDPAAPRNLRVLLAQEAIKREHDAFLQLAKSCCSQVAQIAEVPSINGPDDKIWLNG